MVAFDRSLTSRETTFEARVSKVESVMEDLERNPLDEVKQVHVEPEEAPCDFSRHGGDGKIGPSKGVRSHEAQVFRFLC